MINSIEMHGPEQHKACASEGNQTASEVKNNGKYSLGGFLVGRLKSRKLMLTFFPDPARLF
jgi:hypothetical protein